ncbi:MAG: hypothetical protein K8S16_09375 [Bacteroidales bacterium]|nr:hypothetical protein [Bacteroidales bacterium]
MLISRVKKEGTDLSLITYGNTTHMCLEVASRLANEKNIQAEIASMIMEEAFESLINLN